MASIAPYFFFYLFLAGTILFTILGVLTITGNPAIMVENTRKDESEVVIEEDDLKGRIVGQYFVAAVIDFVFAVLFFVIIIVSKKKESNTNLVYEMDNNQTPMTTQNNQFSNLTSEPEMKNITPEPDNINTDANNVGMSEKENLVSE